jgi:DNA-binding transcriptional MerR regulator
VESIDNERLVRMTTKIVTLSEAAEQLRLPVATLRFYRAQGIGPASFRLGRGVVYTQAALDSWVEQRQQATAS